jgi:hypothetical protein
MMCMWRNLVGPERLRRGGPRDAIPDVPHRLGADGVLRPHGPRSSALGESSVLMKRSRSRPNGIYLVEMHKN